MELKSSVDFHKVNDRNLTYEILGFYDSPFGVRSHRFA